jgi:hypothetical protein
MELGLDLLTLLASNASSSLRAKTPHLLANKVAFIRKHLLPEIPRERARELESILSKVENLAVQRHDLIHGAAYSEERAGAALLVTFGRLLQPRNQERRAPLKVNANHIDTVTADVSNLFRDLLDFAEGYLARLRATKD